MHQYIFKKILGNPALFIVILVSLLSGCIFSTGELRDVNNNQHNIVTADDLPSRTVKIHSEIYINDLPVEARNTLNLIKTGGPFPFVKDGSIFNNYEGLLPKKYPGYYKEYTVITPGLNDRGPRRIIAGKNGELYYTDDHYRSFKRIVE